MITIKVLDKELTMDEARELYNELHQIFGEKTYEYALFIPLEKIRILPEWQGPYVDPFYPWKVTF